MKTIYTLLLTILCNLAVAQFAIIDDKDGFSNIRSTAQLGNNIQDKLENGHFVFCIDATGNWMNVDYELKNQSNNGFIYKDRLKLVTSFEKVGVVTKDSSNAVFKNDSIKITVTSQPFDKTKHKFANGLVNGKPMWGCDGNMPREEYKSITVAWGSKKLVLPKAAIDDLFDPHVEKMQVNYDKTNNVLYIQTDGSDGAGGYEVIWKVVNDIYKGRYVTIGV
jgi:hypothetical protein